MSLLNNALSGSIAARAALDATSQNIANVATAGYTRQAALFVTAGATGGGPKSAGNGVVVSQLMRFSDGYASQQMWRAASTVGQGTVAQPYLTQLEQVMGDDTADLSSSLDAFFAALNAASVDPTSSPLRQQIVASADSLAQRFSSLSSVVSRQLLSVHQQRASTVEQIDSLASQVASLNHQVAAAQATGDNTSALVDARDRRIDALASLVGVQVVEQPDGSRSVSLASGQPLVIGDIAADMTVVGHADGSQSLALSFAQESFTVANGGLSGQLGGLADVERKTLIPLGASIVDLAGQFSSAVNATLSAGFGSSGAAGGPLFVFDATSSTQLLTVSLAATAGSLGLSASATAPGNSDNLQALIGLRSLPVTVTALGSTPVLLGDADVQLVGQLGTASQRNQALLTTATTVRAQSESNWRSISGVNSDEEAASLVQYQQMFQANMKVIGVAGALFDATLSMFG
jgi:flagellar hook-associated protein 1 FlgK